MSFATSTVQVIASRAASNGASLTTNAAKKCAIRSWKYSTNLAAHTHTYATTPYSMDGPKSTMCVDQISCKSELNKELVCATEALRSPTSLTSKAEFAEEWIEQECILSAIMADLESKGLQCLSRRTL
jgi:hypothetical protein